MERKSYDPERAQSVILQRIEVTISFRCAIDLSSRMLDEGVWAEIKAGGEHLRLFSEHNALGVQASVYDVNAKIWIAPSESVEDIEQGKEKVVEYAKDYPEAGRCRIPSVGLEESPIQIKASQRF